MLECGREKFLVFAHHKLVLDHISTELVKKVSTIRTAQETQVHTAGSVGSSLPLLLQLIL